MSDIKRIQNDDPLTAKRSLSAMLQDGVAVTILAKSAKAGYDKLTSKKNSESHKG